MQVLNLNVQVDKLPDGCSTSDPNHESCIFNCSKYCILKQALNRKECFVQNNRNIIPDDCPLIIDNK
jgi:hypothetical protein